MLRLSRLPLALVGTATRVCNGPARAAPVKRKSSPNAKSPLKKGRRLRSVVRHRKPTTRESSATTTAATPPGNAAQRVSSSAHPPHPSFVTPPLSGALAHVSLRDVDPRVLHDRMRSLLVQLVLLSPEPLQPSALYAHFLSVADAETASLFACAEHAVDAYERARQQSGKHVGDKRLHVESTAEDKRKTGLMSSPASVGVDDEENNRAQELKGLGALFTKQYHASVVPLVAALRRRAAGERTAGDAVVPPCREVSRWMLLQILFTDPELRVSAYSGAVCYPTLPSLLLATSDRLQDVARSREAYALQWTPSPVKQASAVAVTDSPTTRPLAHAVWLDGAAGCPWWTTAHAIFTTYDVVSRKQSIDAAASVTYTSRSSKEKNSAAKPAGSGGGPTLDVETPAAVSGLPHTSGHRLVDFLILQSGFARLMADAAVSSLPGEDKRAAKAYPTMGWCEGTQGSAKFQEYVADLIDTDGVFGFFLGEWATARQPSGELYRANRYIIQNLFRFFVSTPTSVARLSTMVRWNTSVQYAGVYRSFFYLVLVLAANPTVRQIADGVQQRIRVTAQCAELFGDVCGASSQQTAQAQQAKKKKKEQRRQAVEAHVRKELLALQSCAVKKTNTTDEVSNTAVDEEDSLRESVRHAFAAEARLLRDFSNSDDSFTEVLCLRVQPHARPGYESAAGAAAASSAPSVSFRGYPLRYIEVLPTWEKTPEEILQYLRRQQSRQHPSGVAAAKEVGNESDGDGWLERHEEPYLLVCAKSAVMVTGRLQRTLQRYANIVNTARSRSAGGVKGKKVSSKRVTLRQLSTIMLWAHEYGVEMACEMLFVQLLENEQYAKLHPPPAADVLNATSKDAVSNGIVETVHCHYSDWTVEFL